MNLIITEACTNNCPYCFATSEMSNTSVKQMDKEVFDDIFKKIQSNPTPIGVNLLGGEPLLNKNLPYFIEKLAAEPNVSVITILTGGVVPNHLFQELPLKEKVLFLFNVNQRKDYRSELQFNRVHQNLAWLIDNGFKVSIGFNIYNLDFDGDEILGYCEKYGITELRTAIAKPTFGVENSKLIDPKDYHLASPKVKNLIVEASKRSIKVNIDCMLPKCFFNDEQLAEIVKVQPDVLSDVFGKCGMGLDVNPEKKMFRCFVVEGINSVSIDDFESIDEIEDYFCDIFDRNNIKPTLFDKCSTCLFAENHTCIGDCYANVSIGSEGSNFQEQISEIYSALEDERFDDAFLLLQKADKNKPAICLLWAYYFYYKNIKDSAIQHARRCINLSNDKEVVSSAMEIINSLADMD